MEVEWLRKLERLLMKKKKNKIDEVEVSINQKGDVQIFKNAVGTFYLYNIDIENNAVNIDKAIQTLRFHLNKLNKELES